MREILFFLFLNILVVGTVFSADKVELIYEESVKLNIVPKHVTNKEHTIALGDGTTYVFDILGRDDLKDRLNNLVLEYQSETYPVDLRIGSVVGFIVADLWHLPDPTVMQPVFKIISADFLIGLGGGIIVPGIKEK